MPRKQKQYHFIYKTTCRVTNKFYYGMHSTNNLDDGYIGSGQRLWKSINKHGRENHLIKILEFLPNREALSNREKELITESLLKDPMCMNLAKGGEGGGFLNFNHEKKCHIGASNWLRNKWKDPEYINSQRIRNSKTLSKTHNAGKIKYDTFTGKTHKEETKQKIGEANSINQSGSNNSQFGTMWITNGIENKKIKKSFDIPDNWKKGRTIHMPPSPDQIAGWTFIEKYGIKLPEKVNRC